MMKTNLFYKLPAKISIKWNYIDSYLTFEYDKDFWVIFWLEKTIQKKVEQVVDVEINKKDFLHFIEYGKKLLSIDSFSKLKEYSKYSIINNNILVIPCNCIWWISEHYFHILDMKEDNLILMKIIFNDLKGKDNILINKSSFKKLLEI